MSGVLPAEKKREGAANGKEKEESEKEKKEVVVNKDTEEVREKVKNDDDVTDGNIKQGGKKFNNTRGGNYWNKPRRPRMDFTDDGGVGRQYTSFEFGYPSGGSQTRGGYYYRGRGRGASAGGQGQQREAREPKPPPELTLPEIVDVPLDVDTDDYKVDAGDLVCFFGRDNYLSNMHIAPFILDGTQYRSVEHYYQACKVYMLLGEQYSVNLSKIPNPGTAKSYVKGLFRKMGKDKQVEEWKKSQSLAILKVAIRQKFLQHKMLCEQLLATGDALLVHAYDRDNFYASGCTEEAVKEWAKENEGSILKVPVEVEKEEYQKYSPLFGKGHNFLGVLLMQIRKSIKVEREMVNMVEKITVADK